MDLDHMGYTDDDTAAADGGGGGTVADAVWRAHAPLVRQAAGGEALPAGLWQRVWGSLNRVLRPAGTSAAYAVPMDNPSGWGDGPTLTYVSRRMAGAASTVVGADYAGSDASYSGPNYAGAAYSGPSYVGAAYNGAAYAGIAAGGPSYTGAAYNGSSYASAAVGGPSYAGTAYSYGGPSYANAASGGTRYAGAAYNGPSYAGANYAGNYTGLGYSGSNTAAAGYEGAGYNGTSAFVYSGVGYSGTAYAPHARSIGRNPSISPALSAALRVFAARSLPISSGMTPLEMAPALAAYFSGDASDEPGGFDPGDATTWAAALDQMYGPSAQGGALPLAIPWGGQPAVPGAVDPDQYAIQTLAADWAPGTEVGYAPGGESPNYAGAAGYWAAGTASAAPRPRDLTPTWITAYLPTLDGAPAERSASRRMVFKAPAAGGLRPTAQLSYDGSSYDEAGYQGASYDGSSYDGSGYEGLSYTAPGMLPGFALSAAGLGHAPSSSPGYAPPPPRSVAVPAAGYADPRDASAPDLFWQADGYGSDSDTTAWADVVAAAVGNGYTAAQAALALSGEETAPPSPTPPGPAKQLDGGASDDLAAMADTVYDLIRRRLAVERERHWD